MSYPSVMPVARMKSATDRTGGFTLQLAGLLIDPFAMTDLKDCDAAVRVIDLIDDSIGTLTHAVLLFRGELLRSQGARLPGKGANAGNDALAVLLGPHGIELLGCGSRDEQSIVWHAASDP